MTGPCCGDDTPPTPTSVLCAKRSLNIAGWLIPSTILVLMPKCSLCFAAYIAIGTGIGISLTSAALLRTTLIVLCVASLAFLLLRRMHRWLRPSA